MHYDKLLSALENMAGVAVLFMTVTCIIKPYIIPKYPLILFILVTILLFANFALSVIAWMSHNTGLTRGNKGVQLWSKHILGHVSKNTMMDLPIFVLLIAFWNYHGDQVPIFALAGNDAEAVKFIIWIAIEVAVTITMAHNTAHGLAHLINKDLSALLVSAAADNYSLKNNVASGYAPVHNRV